MADMTTAPDAGAQNTANTQTAPPTPDAAKTFTQEEVSGIAAREAKKAQESLLKKLGLGDDVKTVQDGLTKFAEWQNAQKSDLEKANDGLKAAKEAADAANGKAAALEMENACLKGGVIADCVSDVATLAKNVMATDDKTDAAAAIKVIVEKYPHFAKPPDAPGKPTFSAQTQTGGTDEHQKRVDEVRKAFGLKPTN